MNDNKTNRQQLACDFIHNNYVSFRRLRFDTIAQKVQLREEPSINNHASEPDRWRYITNADINTMVCDCCTETGAAISSREILTVLNAGDGYTKERRMRLASFCASSNRKEFLTDVTGNRRWLPFEVEAIQNPFFTTLPYDRMYAQAWALACDPTFSYWFELDEIDVLEQHNEDFRAQDSEEQLLPILFDIPAEGKGEFMTTAQISERLVSYGNIKKPMAVSRLGMLLGTAGYKAVNKRLGGIRTRGWIVYQRDTEEINTLKRLLKD